MKTILVPTDFSKAAQNAADVAASLAQKNKANLVLLHVVEDVEEGSFNVEGETTAFGSWEDRIFTAKMIQKSKKQLSKAAAGFIESGIDVKPILRVGSPYHGIQAIITEQKADLIIMGTNGKSPLEEILVGSNTEKVIRRSSCPVLTVNKKPSKLEFKSIVFAVSLRKDELSFPNAVKEIQQLYGSTIHLVRINTPGLFLHDRPARERMEELARRMKLQNYTINIYNDYSEEAGIISFADQVNADLIAMSTHGRTGLSHLLNGSIAEDVANHAKRLVLTDRLDKK
jgi:nucleotide-binding universal stress UspA family protein